MSSKNVFQIYDKHVPSNPCLRAFLKFFNEEESADVVFDVDEPGVGVRRFYSHLLILKACAPSLAEFCDGVAVSSGVGNGVLVVPVPNVRPNIFHHMLYYVYGGTIPGNVLSEWSRDIIDAADRYGMGHLKVLAEVCYVDLTTVTVENVVDNLHFSDTKKCALLKEKVMDFLVENEAETLRWLHGVNPQSESMLIDLLTALAKKKSSKLKSYFDTMSVNDLRVLLDKRGLDIDGTHAMLVRSLQGSYGCVIVEGAGSACVNGRYIAVGECDGKAMYEMRSKHDGADAVFTLQHWKSEEYWCFLYEQKGTLFYVSRIKEEPPVEGWSCANNSSLHPPPLVRLESNKW